MVLHFLQKLLCFFVIFVFAFTSGQEGDVSEEFLNTWIAKIHERFNPDLLETTHRPKSLTTKQSYQSTTTRPISHPTTRYQPITYKSESVSIAAPIKPVVFRAPDYTQTTSRPITFKSPSYKVAAYQPQAYKLTPKPINKVPSNPTPTVRPIAYRPHPKYTFKPAIHETSAYRIAPSKPPKLKPSYNSNQDSYKTTHKQQSYHPKYAEEYAHDTQPHYKYNYAVVDEYSGVDFGANEGRDGYATQGEYRVLLPDCRTQVVKYNTVDAYSGNIADVTYEGSPCHNG